MIRLEAVTAAVPAAPGESAPRAVIRGLDAAFAPGESHLILGPNGAGKTTLIRLLAGLLPPTAGRYLLDGSPVGRDRSLEPLWPRIAVLLEEPDPQFLTDTVEAEASFGLESLALPVEEIRARVAAALESFGLGGVAARPPHVLSAGEKARTLLAAVMVANPGCLLLDQSLAHLDPGSRRELESRLVEEALSGGRAIVRTHQDADSPYRGERVWMLREGVLEDAGGMEAERVLAEESVPLPLALRVSALLASQGRWQGALAVDLARLEAGLRRARAEGVAALRAASSLPAARSAPSASAAPGRARSASPGGAPTISLRGVSWAPRGAGPRPRVLHSVDLELGRGEIVALVGRSGSGKTTLLKLAAGLLEPTSGDVRREAVDGRRGAALALEYPERQLFGRTVGEDVAAILWVAGVPAGARRDRARAAMEEIGLDPSRFEDRAPSSLSEGEKRRAALAGLLVEPPQALLLDEPTAGLDPGGRRALRHALDRLRGSGHSILLASHDLDFVSAVADRLVVLGQGESGGGAILGGGSPADVWRDQLLLERAGLPAPDFIEVGRLLGDLGLLAPGEGSDSESLLSALRNGRDAAVYAAPPAT